MNYRKLIEGLLNAMTVEEQREWYIKMLVEKTPKADADDIAYQLAHKFNPTVKTTDYELN